MTIPIAHTMIHGARTQIKKMQVLLAFLTQSVGGCFGDQITDDGGESYDTEPAHCDRDLLAGPGQEPLQPKSSFFDVVSRSSCSTHSDFSFKNDKLALGMSRSDANSGLPDIYELRTDAARASEVPCSLFPAIDYSQFNPSDPNYIPLFPCSMVPS